MSANDPLQNPAPIYYPHEGDSVIVDQPALNAWYTKLFPGHNSAQFPNPAPVLSAVIYNNVMLKYVVRVGLPIGWQHVPIEFLSQFEPLAHGDSVMFVRDVTNADLYPHDPTYTEGGLSSDGIAIRCGQRATVLDVGAEIIPGLPVEIAIEADSETYFVKAAWLTKL